MRTDQSPTAPARLPGVIERLSRTQRVWLALVGSMTCVGGLLLAVDGRPTPSLDGVALVATPARAASIEAIFNTRAPIEPGRWDGVVIYDSGSMHGSAASIAQEHVERGLHGLGYHFVIGNGAGLDDGELHVGYRWLAQAPGAHTGGPDQDRINRRYIGICLVGDGDRRPFTERQLSRLSELLTALRDRLDIPEEAILLGRDVAPTRSPGRFFPASLAGVQGTGV